MQQHFTLHLVAHSLPPVVTCMGMSICPTSTPRVMSLNRSPASSTVSGTDCNTAANGNAGCGVKFPDTNSYGPSFNSNGGGWYAMERTSTYISVWFWARNSASVPAGVKSGASSLDTSGWGEPSATFTNGSCDIGAHMGPHNIIFNLTFCE